MAGAAPLARGSVSLRLYPHDGLDPAEIVAELRAQAALAMDAGFDGVMTSEHHGGFPGYLPNPLLAAGWCLDAMEHGWAAPCPLLLPLREAALVAEDVAWLDARFPGRVGVGVASGALAADFEIARQSMEGLTARFVGQLTELAGILSGRDLGPIRNDPAVRALEARPVPLVSAAMGFTAARARGRARHRSAVRLAVDASTRPRARGRVPGGGRDRRVHRDPARVDRRATA